MQCPCHSGKSYSECCAPYHYGEKLPPTPLALMRSRYSAFALDNVSYIIETTHPDNPDATVPLDQRTAQLRQFCEDTTFKELEILDSTETLPLPTVTFKAHLIQNEKDIFFFEKSEFAQVDGKWLYKRALTLS